MEKAPRLPSMSVAVTFFFFKKDFDSRNQNGGTTEEWWERQGLLYLKTQEGGAPLRILKITHFKYTRPREAKTNWCQTYLVISRGKKRLKMIKEKKKSRNKI